MVWRQAKTQFPYGSSSGSTAFSFWPPILAAWRNRCFAQKDANWNARDRRHSDDADNLLHRQRTDRQNRPRERPATRLLFVSRRSRADKQRMRTRFAANGHPANGHQWLSRHVAAEYESAVRSAVDTARLAGAGSFQILLQTINWWPRRQNLATKRRGQLQPKVAALTPWRCTHITSGKGRVTWKQLVFASTLGPFRSPEAIKGCTDGWGESRQCQVTNRPR